MTTTIPTGTRTPGDGAADPRRLGRAPAGDRASSVARLRLQSRPGALDRGAGAARVGASGLGARAAAAERGSGRRIETGAMSSKRKEQREGDRREQRRLAELERSRRKRDQTRETDAETPEGAPEHDGGVRRDRNGDRNSKNPAAHTQRRRRYSPPRLDLHQDTTPPVSCDRVTPEIEPGPDGAVLVRGLTIGEVRARLERTQRGRPTHPDVTRDEILAAAAERTELGLPLTQVDLAADLGLSRTRLREAAEEHFGSWRALRDISAT